MKALRPPPCRRWRQATAPGCRQWPTAAPGRRGGRTIESLRGSDGRLLCRAPWPGAPGRVGSGFRDDSIGRRRQPGVVLEKCPATDTEHLETAAFCLLASHRAAGVLQRLSAQFGTGVRTIFSTAAAIEDLVKRADLPIGCVLVPGATAPKLVTRDMLRTMRPGPVIVDVAIDQGGSCETSRATTHSAPTYRVDGIVHYCVANMPGAIARTSTFALNNVTLRFVHMPADRGWRQALGDDPHLRAGLNIHAGYVACAPAATAHELPYMTTNEALAA